MKSNDKMSQLSDLYFHSVVVRFWSGPGDCVVIFLSIKNAPQQYLTLVHVRIFKTHHSLITTLFDPTLTRLSKVMKVYVCNSDHIKNPVPLQPSPIPFSLSPRSGQHKKYQQTITNIFCWSPEFKSD